MSGYLLGCSISNDRVIETGFFKNNRSQNNSVNKNNTKIEIDDKKVVLNIDTKNLEKKYEDLGDTIVSETNIGDSVNKLKNLKG